jgi:CRP/FNR family transcriptional regulator
VEKANRPSPSSLPNLWPPLQACAPETLARLQAASVNLELAAGERLLTAGDVPNRIVVFSEGVLRVFHAASTEQEFTVKLLRTPVAVGLVEVITGNPWAGSVEALTPAAALELPADALRTEIDRDAALARALLSNLAMLFEGTIRSNRHLGFDDCETRLLRVLLEYADHFGRAGDDGLVLRFPLPLERLAREVGVTRRSIDRAISDLGKAGLVGRNSKGWLVLKDRDAARARVGN